jgi:hypothetical protein
MMRVLSVLLALLIAATGLWLSARGAEQLLPILVAHPLPVWFATACSVLVACWVAIAAETKRRARSG